MGRAAQRTVVSIRTVYLCISSSSYITLHHPALTRVSKSSIFITFPVVTLWLYDTSGRCDGRRCTMYITLLVSKALQNPLNCLKNPFFFQNKAVVLLQFMKPGNDVKQWLMGQLSDAHLKESLWTGPWWDQCDVNQRQPLSWAAALGARQLTSSTLFSSDGSGHCLMPLPDSYEVSGRFGRGGFLRNQQEWKRGKTSVWTAFSLLCWIVWAPGLSSRSNAEMSARRSSKNTKMDSSRGRLVHLSTRSTRS